jgi:hypothetical protein
MGRASSTQVERRISHTILVGEVTRKATIKKT